MLLLTEDVADLRRSLFQPFSFHREPKWQMEEEQAFPQLTFFCVLYTLVFKHTSSKYQSGNGRQCGCVVTC